MPPDVDPPWKQRYRATWIGLPRWSEAAPDRLAVISTESGVTQAWTIDLATGERRRASGEPVGVEHVLVAPDGRVVWWRDAVGDERGRWVAAPFAGGEPEPLVPGVPEGWSMGVSFAPGLVALGLSDDDGYRAYVAPHGGAPRLVAEDEGPLGVGSAWPEGTGGLSTDGALLCLRHTEHGDILHHALRVVDVESGERRGDLVDPGRDLDPVAWSPAGHVLLFTSELGTHERPGLWDLDRGERRDLAVDLPGATIPLGWYPAGDAVLVRHEHEAEDSLYRVEVATGRATLVARPASEIEEAAVRPDGDVWLAVSDAAHPLRPVTASGEPVVEVPGAPPPPGVPARSRWFTSPGGERVQALVVTPEGDPPFPVVMHVHGGPEWHHRHRWDPEVQALVDAGFAVALVNYRGSTGYGIAFRERLHGDPWFPESEDVVACLDDLVAAGIADGDRAFFAGWSWGGCLACLAEVRTPDRWRGVFAGIPAADFVAAHWASMPTIRAYDASLYGGDPTELPDLWRERNPMTYVDQARAPLLVIAGEQDPRCPPEGITPFTDALRERGVDVTVEMYAAGHHANAVDERIRHMELILEHFRRRL